METDAEEPTLQMASSNLGLVLKEEAPPTKRAEVRWYQRQDLWAWLYGMVFIGGLIGAIFGLGEYRGWYAPSGFAYNATNTTKQRFLAEPYVEEPGVKGRHGIDAAQRWYFWKLRPELVTSWTRLFVWTCYTVHQLLAWWLMYLAQVNKQSQKGKKYSPMMMSKYNWAAVAVHTFFHLLHLAQTHLTYDGIAQDVSINSSQGSVVAVVLFILLLEFQDRGVFFGWPSVYSADKVGKTMRSWSREPVRLVRKYHGYFIMWAAVYTFWYHPMENTLGHVLGFFHTWILMLQGSLVYTDLHLNRYWRFLLETWVALHAGLVAYQTGGPELMGTKLWPFFTFSFLLLIVLTQLFGLPFWKHLPAWTRVFPFLIYLAVTLYMYSWIPDENGRPWTRLQEVIRIPAIVYLIPLVIWGLVTLGLYIERKVANGNTERSLSNLGRVGYLIAFLLMYVVMVVISWAVQYSDFQIQSTMSLIVHLLCFVVCGSIAVFFVNAAVQASDRSEKSGKITQRSEDNIPGAGLPGIYRGNVIEMKHGQVQQKES